MIWRSKKENSDFVVEVLIDASGSQRDRTSRVALQGYILSEALSQAGIPHSVFGFCSFWDYTVMRRFRDFDEGREANSRIFEFYASANNRDGLGCPYGGECPVEPAGESEDPHRFKRTAVPTISLSTVRAAKIRRRTSEIMPSRIRRQRSGSFVTRGLRVLGVFAGAEKDLLAEQKIFGKDFAYIKDIRNFPV